MADGRSRPRGYPPVGVSWWRKMDHAEAWWNLSKDEKRRWHETHRWPARMAGVLRRPEEGGFDCAFEVSAASSDLPGASDCALAPADATNAQDKRHFKERHRSLKGGGVLETRGRQDCILGVLDYSDGRARKLAGLRVLSFWSQVLLTKPLGSTAPSPGAAARHARSSL